MQHTMVSTVFWSIVLGIVIYSRQWKVLVPMGFLYLFQQRKKKLAEIISNQYNVTAYKDRDLFFDQQTRTFSTIERYVLFDTCNQTQNTLFWACRHPSLGKLYFTETDDYPKTIVNIRRQVPPYLQTQFVEDLVVSLIFQERILDIKQWYTQGVVVRNTNEKFEKIKKGGAWSAHVLITFTVDAKSSHIIVCPMGEKNSSKNYTLPEGDTRYLLEYDYTQQKRLALSCWVSQKSARVEMQPCDYFELDRSLWLVELEKALDAQLPAFKFSMRRIDSLLEHLEEQRSLLT